MFMRKLADAVTIFTSAKKPRYCTSLSSSLLGSCVQGHCLPLHWFFVDAVVINSDELWQDPSKVGSSWCRTIASKIKSIPLSWLISSIFATYVIDAKPLHLEHRRTAPCQNSDFVENSKRLKENAQSIVAHYEIGHLPQIINQMRIEESSSSFTTWNVRARQKSSVYNYNYDYN